MEARWHAPSASTHHSLPAVEERTRATRPRPRPHLQRTHGAQLAARAARVEGHGAEQARHAGGQVPNARAPVAVPAQPRRGRGRRLGWLGRAPAAQHPVPARLRGGSCGAARLPVSQARRAQLRQRQRGAAGPAALGAAPALSWTGMAAAAPAATNTGTKPLALARCSSTLSRQHGSACRADARLTSA